MTSSLSLLDRDRRRASIAIVWLVAETAWLAVLPLSAGCTADLLPEEPGEQAPAMRPRTRPRGAWAGASAGAGNAAVAPPQSDESASMSSPMVGPQRTSSAWPADHEDAGSDGTAETLDAGASADAAAPTTAPDPTPDASLPPPDAAPTFPTWPTGPSGGPCELSTEPGDRVFSCGDLTLSVRIGERCASGGCGVLVEAHASGMSVLQMREATQLHELGESAGFIVIQPSPSRPDTAGTWSELMYPALFELLERAFEVFRVDRQRLHISGFGSGADLALHFACGEPELWASVAAVSSVGPDASCFTPAWQPPVPMLYAHGALDVVSSIDDAQAMIEAIVAQLGLRGDELIAGDALYRRRHWTGDRGMVLDFIEHQYARMVYGGFCIPGGSDTAGENSDVVMIAAACSTPVNGVSWGQAALDWALAHTKAP